MLRSCSARDPAAEFASGHMRFASALWAIRLPIFLAQLAQEYSGRPCIFVLDNVSCHAAVVVQKFLDELSRRFEAIWLPPYSPGPNDIERIWKYVKGASLANCDFGDVTNLRQAIAEVFDEIDSNSGSDLTLRFRDPLSKDYRGTSKK